MPRHRISKIPHLRREVALLPEIRNPTEEELQLAVRRTRLVLRDHVARQRRRHEGEAALRMPGAHDARRGDGAEVQLAVVRDEEVVRGRGLEAERAVPGHVLDHEEGAVGNEDVVEQAVADEDVVRALDDAREDGHPGGRGGVGGEDAVGAFLPFLLRRVDGGLHVAAVEVDVGAGRHVVEGAREAEHVPEQRAGGGDLVDVEARVDLECGVEDGVPHVAGALVAAGKLALRWLRTGWGVGEILGEVVGVAAGIGEAVHLGEIRRVEVDERAPVIDKRYGRNY